MPPLGLTSIAAVLKKAGHEVMLIDAALEPQVGNEIWASQIVQWNPELVGFTATTSGFLDAYDVCRRIKEKRSSIETVFGGVHVSSGKEHLLKKFEAIDYLVLGEGENALARLADGQPLDSIEGLLFRDGAEVKSGPEMTNAIKLDELPFPAYELLHGFPKRYRMPLFGYPRHPGANIISSRGCVYSCSYCDRSVFGKSFRWNSPEYTFEQIRWLRRDFGVHHVNFYDDLFTLNRKRVSRLCELLTRSHLRVTFNCIVRIGHIDEELIKMLKSAGCWMVNVGIESGDQSILDKHKTGVTLEDIRSDIQRLHNAGLWVKGLFMMGFPGETIASIQATREFALSLPLKDANITAFTPFPGAPITSEIENYGTLDNDWSKMDCEHFVFVPDSIGSQEKLEEQYRLFIAQFYKRKSMRKIYRAMVFQSPHSYWRLVRSAPQFLRYTRELS